MSRRVHQVQLKSWSKCMKAILNIEKHKRSSETVKAIRGRSLTLPSDESSNGTTFHENCVLQQMLPLVEYTFICTYLIFQKFWVDPRISKSLVELTYIKIIGFEVDIVRIFLIICCKFWKSKRFQWWILQINTIRSIIQ